MDPSATAPRAPRAGARSCPARADQTWIEGDAPATARLRVIEQSANALRVAERSRWSGRGGLAALGILPEGGRQRARGVFPPDIPDQRGVRPLRAVDTLAGRDTDLVAARSGRTLCGRCRGGPLAGGGQPEPRGGRPELAAPRGAGLLQLPRREGAPDLRPGDREGSADGVPSGRRAAARRGGDHRRRAAGEDATLAGDPRAADG